MSYVVSGVDRKTGASVTRVIAASSEDEALKVAALQNIEVTRLFRSASTQTEQATPATDAVRFQSELETSTPHTYATYSLMGANALVLLVMTLSGVNLLRPGVDDLLHWGARYGPAIAGGEWWRLFTSLFVHIGLQHLLYNMLALAYVGPLMERMLGRVGFLLLYFVAGLGAGLLCLWVNPLQVGAGASGAIFGLYAGLFALVLRRHHRIPEMLAKGLTKFVLVFVGINLLYSFMPGVGMAAHLGGLIIGLLGGLVLADPKGDARSRGGSRNVPLAGVGVMMLAGAAVAGMVSADQGYTNVGRLTQLVKESNATMRKFKDAEDKHYRDDSWDIDFAALIDHELLPAWRNTREAFAQVTPVPKKLQGDVDALRRYLQMREEAWQTLVMVKRDSLAQMRRDKTMDDLRSEGTRTVMDDDPMRLWIAQSPREPSRERLGRLIERFEALEKRTEAVRFTPAAADIDAKIERELLPEWRALKKDFDQYGEPPKQLRTSFLTMARAVYVNQEYWAQHVASRHYELRKEAARDKQSKADDAARQVRHSAWSELAPLY